MADAVKTEFLSQFAKVKDQLITSNNYLIDEYRDYTWRRRELNKADIEKILLDGSLTEKQHLSERFYQISGFYKQILRYYATLLKYVGVLIPAPSFGKTLSKSYISKRYNIALDYVESMRLST